MPQQSVDDRPLNAAPIGAVERRGREGGMAVLVMIAKLEAPKEKRQRRDRRQA
jgi:hypothetical protein